MVHREPKMSVEVPVEAVAVVDTTMHVLTPSSRVNAVACEATENLKMVSRVTGETSATVKEVKDKVDLIASQLQASEMDRIMLLENELEMVKSHEQAAKKGARAAKEAVEIRDSMLTNKERMLAEAESQLQRVEQKLQEEIAAHKQTQLAVEEAHRAARIKDEQLSEMDIVRANDCNRAEAEALLQAECRKKDTQISELQQQLRATTDQCNTFKVRHANLEKEIDQKATETADFQELLLQRDMQSAQLRERFDHEAGALTQEKEGFERMLVDMNRRYQALELEHHAFEEQQIRQGQANAVRETSLRQQEQEIVEKERTVALQQQHLAQREKELKDAERVRQDVSQKRADFEQQREEMERQLERQRAELERQIAEQRERHRRAADTDKENRAIRQTVQEQKSAIYDLQSTLIREQTVASFITPGEYLKIAKKQEGETLSHENARLKVRLSGLEAEAGQARCQNEALQRLLPPAARGAVAKDLLAQPLPVYGSAQRIR
jgi:hypothetical protein